MATTDLLTPLVVVGLGYVGLPTAALFASAGHHVRGVDISADVVARLTTGESHLDEPGLAELVEATHASGQLTVSLEPIDAAVFFIAVPTPLRAGRQPDVSLVNNALESIAPFLQADSIVIIESTCPVGTTRAAGDLLRSLRPDLEIASDDPTVASVAVAYCPERVLPGNILAELRLNDRVVGGLTNRCADRAAAIYQTVIEGSCQTTEASTAELVKLAENAYRDVNIAFANELNYVAETHGVDPREVIDLANQHPRVNVLSPGPGVGGHCIAVDPWFIVAGAPEQTPLIQAARAVNDGKPHAVAAHVGDLAAAKNVTSIACLGLSYKPNVGDLRESPSLEIALTLAKRFDVTVVEPNITKLPEPLASMAVLDTLDAALASSDLVLIQVAHRQFVEQVDAITHHPCVVDVVGLLWTAEKVK